MLVDAWHGLAVHRSADGREWIEQEGRLLDEPGRRENDDEIGGHPDALVLDGRVFLLYHVRLAVSESADGFERRAGTGTSRRTALQVAELECEDGWLPCDRDAAAGAN